VGKVSVIAPPPGSGRRVVATVLLSAGLLPACYQFGSGGKLLGGHRDAQGEAGNGSGSSLCRGLARPGADPLPMGATGLEPVTSSLSSWRSPN
jgi:hypothetical protein